MYCKSHIHGKEQQDLQYVSSDSSISEQPVTFVRTALVTLFLTEHLCLLIKLAAVAFSL